jgi:plastocyanin
MHNSPFQPSEIAVQRGDTVRFLQTSSAPHNVAFRKRPKTAKPGGAATGPYVISAGQTYDLVIDQRFPDGAYAFACDPHEGAGMHGVLNVGPLLK